MEKFLDLSSAYVQVDYTLKALIMQVLNDNVDNCREDPMLDLTIQIRAPWDLVQRALCQEPV